ncbi:hypothetical protein [Anaerovorax sp. IOR16]|uniref:hypothetical protein n=1 Tax=Anaerovorax sp. IOR16 TaxID=2773458 RepID=UPI0019D16916|nr:hypothetical protein [Anaerovorax sp. IOR16]
MDMTVKHVNLEILDEFYDEAKQSLGTSKSLSLENNKRFLEMRIKYLDGYLDELEQQQKHLEEELINGIQQLIADKGAEILSIKQIIKLAAKECGVCEASLDTLNEQLENGELKNA